MKSPIPLERDEQITVVEWLEIHRIEFFAVPNGGIRPAKQDQKGRRYSNAGRNMQKEGVKAGVPDIVIIDRPPFHPSAPGAVVEMKRIRGSKIDPEQRTWAEKFQARGWPHVFARGAGEAIAFLRELGYHTIKAERAPCGDF